MTPRLARNRNKMFKLCLGFLNVVYFIRWKFWSTNVLWQVALGWGHALALTEDGKLFGWGYFADGRIGSIKESLETSQLESTSSNQELSSSSLEAAEKLVLEGMAKENNMPIVWEPSLVRELHSIKVVDIACGLDHSLILCGR